MPLQPEIDIRPIAARLADALTLAEGRAWTHELPASADDDRPWIQTLISPDGQAIDIERAHVAGRIAVRVAFGPLYQFLPHDHPSYKRTLNPQRPIGALAREIRRLLDSARPALAEACARKAAADDYEARREQLAAQLARLANYERATHAPTLIYIGSGQHYGRTKGRGRLSVDGPDTVALDIRVPPDLAEQIIILMIATPAE